MKRFLIVLVLLLALLALAPFAAFYTVRAYYEPGLPDISGIRDIPMGRPVRVLSADGKLLAEYGVERRTPLPLTAFPRQVIDAFLAAEDDNFYQHPGVDWKGIARAGLHYAQTHVRSQGGSTITMQLARNLFLTPEKSWERKVREILLAMKIERELSKDEILEIYLNRIFLGTRAYGVGAAAKVYFGKDVQQLTLAEAATIAGLPKAPSQLNPIVSPGKAQARRAYVLGRMRQLNMISDVAYQEAMVEPMLAFEHTAMPEVDAPDMAEMVRQELLARYGETVYTSGYTVTTTLDSRLQEAANQAVRTNLLTYEERHGWDGPDARAGTGTPAELLASAPRWPDLEPGIVEGFTGGELTLDTRDAGRLTLPARASAWAGNVGRRAHPGDRIWLRHAGPERAWRLSNIPHVQGALVSLDADDGAIRAMVGRLRLASRPVQPRGAGVPAGGLELQALPLRLCPGAFGDAGQRLSRRAHRLRKSRRHRMEARELFQALQRADAVARSPGAVAEHRLGAHHRKDRRARWRSKCATRLGLPKERLPASLSLSLGTADLSPLQLARGYATFANGGVVVEPYVISVIQDANGAEVARAKPVRAADPLASRAMDARTIWLIDNIMHDVATRGTAAASNVLQRNDLAGKTRHQQQPARRLVRRFQRAHRDDGVDGLRPARGPGRRRDWRAHRAAGVDRLHARGAGRHAPRSSWPGRRAWRISRSTR